MIWHAFKEKGDPTWDMWALEREDGKTGAPALRLSEIRAAGRVQPTSRSSRGVQLHRGVHPEPDRRGPMVSISPFVHRDGFYDRRDFRCWWYDDGLDEDLHPGNQLQQK